MDISGPKRMIPDEFMDSLIFCVEPSSSQNVPFTNISLHDEALYQWLDFIKCLPSLQRMSPNGLVDLLTFPLLPPSGRNAKNDCIS